MRAKSQTSVGKLAVPPIQGVIHYRHRQNFFSPRTDRCCFPWMGMSCRSSGQACIRRDSRGCSLPSKNIQDWSRVDTFKLSYHDKNCPPEVTNRAGKAACFGQLMRGQSQAGIPARSFIHYHTSWASTSVNWQWGKFNCCRVPACSYDLGYNISFSRERQMPFPLHLECLNSPSASTSQRVQLPLYQELA